jgi:Na+/citrate or Na+/malate symporter
MSSLRRIWESPKYQSVTESVKSSYLFFGERYHYSLNESIGMIVIDLQCIANTTDQRLQI